jgi:hypothetical protein
MVRMALTVMLVVAASRETSANDFGPIFPVTGAPNEPITGDGANCTSFPGCHQSFALNGGPGTLTIQVPASYEPGMTYAIMVDIAQVGPGLMRPSRWGFQLTVLDELLQKAGNLATIDLNAQIAIFDPRQYVSHTTAGTADGQENGNSWTFEWTAPDTDVGPVTFYAAGNAANGNNLSTGDYIYTTTASVVAVSEPGTLAGALVGLSATALLARHRRRP